MTGTLRSRRRDGAFRFSYHSPPVLTADAASQRGSKQTEEARCRRQQESSWRLTELVGRGRKPSPQACAEPAARPIRTDQLPSRTSKRCSQASLLFGEPALPRSQLLFEAVDRPLQ